MLLIRNNPCLHHSLMTQSRNHFENTNSGQISSKGVSLGMISGVLPA